MQTNGRYATNSGFAVGPSRRRITFEISATGQPEFFNGKRNADQWLICDQCRLCRGAEPQAHQHRIGMLTCAEFINGKEECTEVTASRRPRRRKNDRSRSNGFGFASAADRSRSRSASDRTACQPGRADVMADRSEVRSEVQTPKVGYRVGGYSMMAPPYFPPAPRPPDGPTAGCDFWPYCSPDRFPTGCGAFHGA